MSYDMDDWRISKLKVKTVIEREHGDSDEDIANAEKAYQATASQVNRITQSTVITALNKKTMSVAQTYEKFLLYKKQNKISASSLKQYNASYNYFCLFVDKDSDMARYDSMFFYNMQEKLTQIPSNMHKYKEFQNKSANEIIQINKKLKLSTLTNKTINNHISFIKSLYDYLADRQILTPNPVTLKQLAEEEPTRDAFTDDELREIFDPNNKYMNEEKMDFFLVTLYTCTRLKEVCHIKKTDIREGCIFIEEGKSANAVRKIPIHSKIAHIIENRIKQSKNEYLFYNGNNDAIGKAMNERTIRKFISDPNKTFHSLKHNTVQQFDDLEHEQKISTAVSEYLRAHAETGNTKNKHYSKKDRHKKYNTEVLKQAIEMLDFDFVFEEKSSVKTKKQTEMLMDII
jgi:integrase